MRRCRDGSFGRSGGGAACHWGHGGWKGASCVEEGCGETLCSEKTASGQNLTTFREWGGVFWE
jgi:hypothetical protein